MSGEDFEYADAAGDQIERGDIQKLAKAFDLHTHAATRGLGVRRLHTASAPTTTGEVQITGDDQKWWGGSAGAVRTAVHVEGAQTITGAKTFSAAVVVNASTTLGVGTHRIGTQTASTAIGFFDGTAQNKQTVTGSRGGNAALASLLTALANYGLIVDGSS